VNRRNESEVRKMKNNQLLEMAKRRMFKLAYNNDFSGRIAQKL
jgi:hypothetical protein